MMKKKREIRLVSWNVNGLRAIKRKGAWEWVKGCGAEVVALQETKAKKDQLDKELRSPEGYEAYFAEAERAGYSGVVTYTKEKPRGVEVGLGLEEFAGEGRVVRTDFDFGVVLNVYFPNGKRSKERLDYKLDFYEAFLRYVKDLRSEGKGVIFCGDVNTAHKEKDLARPKENEKISGFLPEEREWIDRVVEAGFYDSFRMFNEEGGNYTWWALRSRARERNVGWRIDYFFVSEELKERVRGAEIYTEVEGSDHCPIGLRLEV